MRTRPGADLWLERASFVGRLAKRHGWCQASFKIWISTIPIQVSGVVLVMKLYLLQLALLQPMGSPVPGYVIQTDEGTNILIDTGLPYSTIANPQGPPGMHPEMHEEDYVVNRLASIGLAPHDIQF